MAEESDTDGSSVDSKGVRKKKRGNRGGQNRNRGEGSLDGGNGKRSKTDIPQTTPTREVRLRPSRLLKDPPEIIEVVSPPTPMDDQHTVATLTPTTPPIQVPSSQTYANTTAGKNVNMAEINSVDFIRGLIKQRRQEQGHAAKSDQRLAGMTKHNYQPVNANNLVRRVDKDQLQHDEKVVAVRDLVPTLQLKDLTGNLKARGCLLYTSPSPRD